MVEQNKTAGMLAILGGIFMLIGGVTGAASWERLGDMAHDITGIEAFGLLFQILVVMGSLGGLLVILGGLLFRADKVGGGKALVAIGAGMGLFGLIIFLVLTAFGDDPGNKIIGGLSLGFVGLILSIAARMEAL